MEEKEASGSLVTSTESDEVFHWGREVDVDWRNAAWVTIRDQVSIRSYILTRGFFHGKPCADSADPLPSRPGSPLGCLRYLPRLLLFSSPHCSLLSIAHSQGTNDRRSGRVNQSVRRRLCCGIEVEGRLVEEVCGKLGGSGGDCCCKVKSSL